MVEEDPLAWETEPSSNFLPIHKLFRAVHKVLWVNWPNLDKIQPNFFSYNKINNGLSVDWNKYSTSRDTLNRRKEPNLRINGIVEFKVGILRDCIKKNNFPFSIKHSPRIEPPINRSHSLIAGIKKVNRTKVKRKLSKIVIWSKDMKPIRN